MVTLRSEAYTFDLSGGRRCLDLANTVSDRGSDRPIDHLRTYGDLIAWARQAGAVAPGVARALLAEAAARTRWRACAADTCEWLFLDRTKNRTRRWCDMKICGNRAKARRFRARH